MQHVRPLGAAKPDDSYRYHIVSFNIHSAGVRNKL